MAKYPLLVACELTELGRELVAQRYRRANPAATEVEVAKAVAVWMSDRSQAPNGDGVGTPVSWPLGR
jgi:hypothetical protein